jgi:hypothetical protein
MTYEYWWDKRYGDKYAIRIDNGKVTGCHKVAPDETVTAESLPVLFYDGDPGNLAWCEEARSRSEVLLSVEAG